MKYQCYSNYTFQCVGLNFCSMYMYESTYMYVYIHCTLAAEAGRKPGRQRENSSYTAACWGVGPPTCIFKTYTHYKYHPPPLQLTPLSTLTTYMESDLFGHSFSLIGESCGVAVPPSFIASLLTQLKFLQEQNTCTCNNLTHDPPNKKSRTRENNVQYVITSASRLSISGVAFSMEVFCMKAHASSVFSALI